MRIGDWDRPNRYNNLMLLPVIAGLAFATLAPAQLPAGRHTPQTAQATITVGDQIQITVVGFAEYSGRYTVINDGTVATPPIGRIKVQGRTLGAVQSELTTRMRRFVRDPRITVSFVSKADNYVFLVGLDGTEPRQAYRPGYDLRTFLAGIKLPANLEDYEGAVFRSGQRIAEFNLRKLLAGQGDLWSGALEPGDLISVLPAERIRVWFLNDFHQVGEARLFKGSSLAKGIAAMGGPKPSERLSNYSQAIEERSRVSVRRGDRTYQFRIKNDPEAERFELESGDTVSLEAPKSATVTVQGYVKTPAPVTVLSGDNINTAIAAAGGVLDAGTLQNVLLWRGSEVRRIDLRSLTGEGEVPALALQDGDAIFVPKNEKTFRVLGDARNPGIFPIADNTVVRAADAVASAGGIGPDGSLRRVILMRAESDGVYRGRQFNLDEYIKDGKIEANPEILPGDVLFVSKPKGGPSLRDVLNFLPNLLFIRNSVR
ncbi:MAG: hypothetical protein EOP84_00160 [Verrucomicrobiaceae bacterium]|nr:MAG: hypothetical protein EOP84_00160 [Verrucomicrobiaceae bacterium]